MGYEEGALTFSQIGLSAAVFFVVGVIMVIYFKVARLAWFPVALVALAAVLAQTVVGQYLSEVLLRSPANSIVGVIFFCLGIVTMAGGRSKGKQ